MRFTAADVSVIVLKPRYVLLRLRTPWIKCLLIAAHAPHSGHSEDEIVTWWHTLRDAIPQALQEWPCILMADANAKVGADACSSIGTHGAEEGGDKALPFTEFVRSQGLWLPSTFSCHTGTTGTWRHLSGKWLRNDFIGLPTSWTLADCASWVSDDIDVSLHHEDHRAALVRLKMHVTKASQVRRPGPLKSAVYDADLTGLRGLQGSPPALDIHSHAQYIQQQVVDCLPRRAQQSGPKRLKYTLSDRTWQLVQEKRQWRAALHEASKLQQQTILQFMFQVWHCVCSHDTFVPELQLQYTKLLGDQDRVIAQALRSFRLFGRLVVQASRSDDINYFQEVMHEGAQFLAPTQAKDLWRVIKKALPKYRQRRITLDPLSRIDLEAEWNPHFEALEAGCVVAPEVLLAEARCQHIEQRCDEPPSFHDIPTLFDLEKVLRNNRPGRATGNDPLTSDLFHNQAAALAEHAYSLMVKMWMWGEEPLQYKGGPMALIPKKPQPAAVADYRGILLLPTLAKSFHALLRKAVMRLLHHQRLPGQLGGFAQQEVLFGSHALRILGRAAVAKQLSVGVLFVDLSTAFHCLVRELVVGISDPAKFQFVLDALSHAETPMHRLELSREIPSLLQQLGAPPHLVRLLQNVHDSTWTSINGQEYICTHRGTRPGSPLADIVFHYLMFDFSIALRAFLESEGHAAFICSHLDMLVDMIIWSDDLAVPVVVADAGALVPALMRLLDFVTSEFEQRGFKLNMAKGKTGIVATFCGPGAVEQRRRYQLLPQPGLFHLFPNGKEKFVHFMPAYRHLGTLYTSDQILDAEIAFRIGTASSAFEQVRRRLLCNKHLPLALRLQLFRSLILSKLFFASGSWHTPTGRQIGRLQAVVVRFLRKILGDCAQRRQPAQVLTAAGVLEPRAYIAVERLLYAQRLFHHGPDFLQQMVHAEGASIAHPWLMGLRHDLVWLHGVEAQVDEMLLVHDMTSIIDSWQGDTGTWKRRVKRASQRHLFQEAMIQEAQQWHADIFAILRQRKFVFQPDPATLHVQDCIYPCPDCHRSFGTAQGMHTHRRRVHGVYCPEHHLLDSATCPACLTYLWSTQRLQQHVSYMPKDGSPNPCFAYLQQIGFSVSYTAEALPKVMRGQSRLDALPALGPFGHGPTRNERRLAALRAEKARLEAEYAEYLKPTDGVTAGAKLGDLLALASRQWYQDFCRKGRHFEEADRLQDRWIDILCRLPSDFEFWASEVFLRWGQHILPDLISELLDGEAEYYFDEEFADLVTEMRAYEIHNRFAQLDRDIVLVCQPEPHQLAHRPVRPPQQNAKPRSLPQFSVPRLFCEQERWQAELETVRWYEFPVDPPTPLVPGLAPRPSFVIVHLFAGRRRATDLHSWLAAWATRTNVSLTILSLDTAISPVLGNLDCQSVTWSRLQELYTSGYIAATISGHPCETYSSARWHRPPDLAPEMRWPRPLRTAMQLFGLDHRTWRELKQTRMGSAFFLQTVWTLACHIAFGGLYIEEHPGLPQKEHHPSIWKSAILKTMQRHPDIHLHHISQWKFGASTVKPTGLLVLRMPFFLRDLYLYADNNAQKPTAQAIGVSPDGTFCTAVHKEYPERLSSGLACAVASQLVRITRARLTQNTSDPVPPLVQWIREVARDCKDVRAAATWLPDYQG